MLAAVPSSCSASRGVLVLGPFIVNTLGPWLHDSSAGPLFFDAEPTVGSSMFAAILILTIMITPIVSSHLPRALPAACRATSDGALDVGATGWRACAASSFPTPAPASPAAIILGLGRAVGEAIAVTQVIGDK